MNNTYTGDEEKKHFSTFDFSQLRGEKKESSEIKQEFQEELFSELGFDDLTEEEYNLLKVKPSAAYVGPSIVKDIEPKFVKPKPRVCYYDCYV